MAEAVKAEGAATGGFRLERTAVPANLPARGSGHIELEDNLLALIT